MRLFITRASQEIDNTHGIWIGEFCLIGLYYDRLEYEGRVGYGIGISIAGVLFAADWSRKMRK